MLIYIKVVLLFFKVILNLHKYKDFTDKPDGLGKKWTLYKRPIFGKKIRDKKTGIPNTRAHHFIYHAYEALETKENGAFKKEILDSIILGSIWYATVEKREEKIEDKKEDTSPGDSTGL